MGSVVRSIPWSLIYSNLPLRLTCAQPIRTRVRERLRLAAEIPLQIGRRGGDSEPTLTHLATLEGTEQWEKQASAVNCAWADRRCVPSVEWRSSARHLAVACPTT